MLREPDPSEFARITPRWRWLQKAHLRAHSSVSGLVDQSILLLFTTIRGFMVVQLVISAAAQLQLRPATDVALMWAIIAIAFSLTWIVVANATGRLDAWPWGLIDITVGVGALVACELTLPTVWTLGTWLDWSVDYVGRVLIFVPAWLRSIKASIAVGAATSVIYLALVLPNPRNSTVATLEGLVGLIVSVTVSLASLTILRRVAIRADRNQARAIEAGADHELLRYRAQVHDATGLLAQLSRSDTPATLRSSLQQQAAAESNRLRNEILRPRRGRGQCDDDTIFLDTVLYDATSGFSYLPLRLSAHLVREVLLTPEQASALKSALIALLYNVAFHAQAQQVTVYADHDQQHWEVSVCDDGIGFQPDESRFGFGLGTQVVASLATHGLEVSVDSAPGAGTSVVISGNCTTGATTENDGRVQPIRPSATSSRSPGESPKARSTSAGE